MANNEISSIHSYKATKLMEDYQLGQQAMTTKITLGAWWNISPCILDLWKRKKIGDTNKYEDAKKSNILMKPELF